MKIFIIILSVVFCVLLSCGKGKEPENAGSDAEVQVVTAVEVWRVTHLTGYAAIQAEY